MYKNNPKNILLLFITAIIWGFSTALQKIGVEHIDPFTFNSIRFILGGCLILPIALISNKKNKLSNCPKTPRKSLFLGSILCGIVLAAASTLQLFGLPYAAAGKAGFITSLYIILVPLLNGCLGKKITPMAACASLIGMLAFFIISMGSQLPDFSGNILNRAEQLFSCLTPNSGDLLLLLCAFFFAVHILLIDHFINKTNILLLSCTHFFVAGLSCLIAMLIFENPSLEAIKTVLFPLLYSGLISCGIGFTLQAIGQKNTDASLTALILSLEAVSALFAGWLLMNERLSGNELLGCLLVSVAIVLAIVSPQNKYKPLKAC